MENTIPFPFSTSTPVQQFCCLSFLRGYIVLIRWGVTAQHNASLSFHIAISPSYLILTNQKNKKTVYDTPGLRIVMFHNQLDLKAQLKQYKLYHREKTNVLIHMVFVPTILFSTCCMAHRIPLGHGITLTNVLTTVFALHYVLLCFVPGLIASLLLAVLNWSLDNGKIRLHAYQEVSLFVMVGSFNSLVMAILNIVDQP